MFTRFDRIHERDRQTDTAVWQVVLCIALRTKNRHNRYFFPPWRRQKVHVGLLARVTRVGVSAHHQSLAKPSARPQTSMRRIFAQLGDVRASTASAINRASTIHCRGTRGLTFHRKLIIEEQNRRYALLVA